MDKSFRGLVAFQRAKELMLDVYEVTRQFPREEKFGLVAQLRRSSISVMANIAEGHGRVTFGEWRQFLSQARGSLFEIEAECIAAEALGYVMPEQMQRLTLRINRTGSALIGFIAWVQRQTTSKPRNLATPQPTAQPQSRTATQREHPR